MWSNETVFTRLLEEVERKPCVWKKSDPKYMNKHVKSAAFEEIGIKIGVSANAVKEKLRSLRTIFLQNHKKNEERKWSSAATKVRVLQRDAFYDRRSNYCRRY